MFIAFREGRLLQCLWCGSLASADRSWIFPLSPASLTRVFVKRCLKMFLLTLQVWLASARDARLFHSVYTWKASSRELNLFKILAWGLNGPPRNCQQADYMKQAHDLMTSGLGNVAEALLKRLDHTAGLELQDSVLHDLVGIVTEASYSAHLS